MWIRSQDKLLLSNCERFALVGQREYSSENNAIVPNGKWDVKAIYSDVCEHEDIELLGTYASKERALQVRDEMQDHIEEMRTDSLMAALGDKGTYDVIAWGESVYQMPES
jgi:hypothetical protein